MDRFQGPFWFAFLALMSCWNQQHMSAVEGAAPCKDTRPPVVTCPNDIILERVNPVLPNVVVYRPGVDDDCIAVISQEPQPGMVLNAGQSYDVIVTATDLTNKTDSCTWTVTVPEIVSRSRTKVKIQAGKSAVAITTRKRRRSGLVVGLMYRLTNGNLRGGSIKFYANVNGVRSDPIVLKSGTEATRHIRGFFDFPVNFVPGDAVEIEVQGTGVRASNSAWVSLLVQYL